MKLMPRLPLRIGVHAGQQVAFIPLPHGLEAIVSRRDLPRVRRINWSCMHGYVVGWVNGQRIRMHRFILGLKRDDPDGDHRNGNKLDNRRRNLRPDPDKRNAQNQRIRSSNSTGYKGVSYHTACMKWTARICVNYQCINLGVYTTPFDAARAYDKAARKYHGRFARLNFPQV